jgi:alpha-tubulin suppressor-like RCC1 family protein
VEDLSNVMDIAAGGSHNLAVMEGGAVYTWGENRDGQLGLGDHGFFDKRNVPTLVDGVNGMVAVAAGNSHSFILSRDGTVMACGGNRTGQLGLGDTDNRDTFTVVADLRDVVDIEAGGSHSLAVTAEGGLYTWGEGWAIGHGGDCNTQRLVPTKVTGGGIGEAVVVQVAAGDYHSLALTTTGELYAWGMGYSGQLGHGDKENLAVPRAVGGIGGAVVGMAGGRSHSLVTTAEGRVLAFGSNGEIQFVDYNGEIMDGGEGSEGDETVIDVDGRLGLRAGVEEALTSAVIDGITIGEGREGKEGKE